MRVLGIIAEYNPFHFGHLYHLRKSKELIKADYAVAVMSGQFTQRGEAAIADKWIRAETAVRCVWIWCWSFPLSMPFRLPSCLLMEAFRHLIIPV